MSVAWTTLLVIALLLPGVFFLAGITMQERFSRDVVRTSGLFEIGVALVVALFLHLLSWWILGFLKGFQLQILLWPVLFPNYTTSWRVLDAISTYVWWVAWYIIVVSIISFFIGWIFSKSFLFTTHRWLRRFGSYKGFGDVTAYILTNIQVNDRVLMYRGQMRDYYLTADGKFSYIVLSNCSRFLMMFDKESPATGAQLDLFPKESERGVRMWNYFMIHGENISNVLFEKVPEITLGRRDEEQLDAAIREAIAAIRIHPKNSN